MPNNKNIHPVAAMPKFSRSPLASKLLRAVLSVYLTVALLVTCVQLVFEYQEEQKRLQSELNQVAEAFLPVLAIDLWNLDNEQLDETANAIWVNSAIGRLEIINDLNETITTREREYQVLTFAGWEAPWYNYQYDVNHENSSQPDQFVGTLHLSANSIVVFQRAASTFIYTIVNAGIKTLVLWFIFHFTLSRFVATPLSMLTKAVRRINPDSKDYSDANIQNLSELHTDDELGELAESFTDFEAALVEKNQAIQERQNNLEQMVEELERASKAKSIFLAHMSHELRTPLNGMLGMVEFLGDTKLDKAQSDYVSILSNTGQQLLAVINNVLDISKIESGKLELEIINFDLELQLKTCIQQFQPIALKKGIELEYSFKHSGSHQVSGDLVKLTQILNNLIGNAVKFTSKGKVSVLVDCDPLDNGYDYRFSISDTGIGFPEEKLGLLFHSFSQLDKSTTREYGGTGLGLAICKQLIDLMNGSIEVKSEQGIGSEFTVKLVLGKPILDPISEQTINLEKGAVANHELQETPIDSQLPGLNVLVADDNHINQLVITGMLKKLGIHADTSDDGKDVLDKCEIASQPYDLIFMDIEMPNMDGWEATMEIRKNGLKSASGEPIKIIGLSAHALNVEQDTIKKRGMDAYISKPVSINTLSQVLSTIELSGNSVLGS